METLFDGIPLDRGQHVDDHQRARRRPARNVYRCRGKAGSRPGASSRGTLQNDILKEYIAQKEWIYPPEPALKLVVDTIEYTSEHCPSTIP